MTNIERARRRLDDRLGFKFEDYGCTNADMELKRLTLAADGLTDSPELRRERERLDNLLPTACNEDWLRMQLASDVLVGKESYIKQLEAEGGCELLAEGHLAMVSEYGLDYGTTPIDVIERRGERAYHAAWVIQKLRGDLKDARQGGALFAAMHEADEKLIQKLQTTILIMQGELYQAADE